MVTFDWRRCPQPDISIVDNGPVDAGLPQSDYETGVLSDQSAAVGYGPLSSDLGPRFGQGLNINGDDVSDDADNGLGNGISICWLIAAGAALMTLRK